MVTEEDMTLVCAWPLPSPTPPSLPLSRAAPSVRISEYAGAITSGRLCIGEGQMDGQGDVGFGEIHTAPSPFAPNMYEPSVLYPRAYVSTSNALPPVSGTTTAL